MNELETLLKLTDKMASTYNWFRKRGEENKSIFMAFSFSILAQNTIALEKRYRGIRDRFLYDMERMMKADTGDLDESTVRFINDFSARLRANDGVFQVNSPDVA